MTSTVTFSPRDASIQVTSASISLAASAATSLMICCSNGGLSTPYRRIVFALSLSDCLQSLALLTGPFVVPRVLKEQFPWAMGNLKNCEASALSLGTGMIGVSTYTLLLCVYYLCKAKYMTNNDFFHKFELRTHALVILFGISMCSAALVTKALGPLPSGTVCSFSAYPPGCRMHPEIFGECIYGDPEAVIFSVALLFGFNGLIFICVGISTLMLYSHSIKQGLVFKEQHKTAGRSRCGGCLEVQEQQPDETSADYIARLYRRETLTQSGLYATAFFGVHFPPFILSLAYLRKATSIPSFFRLFMSLVCPLGGLFNILIYTRPKVAVLRRTYPQFSRIQAIWVVLKAGCDIPSNDKLERTNVWFTCCCKKDSTVRPAGPESTTNPVNPSHAKSPESPPSSMESSKDPNISTPSQISFDDPSFPSDLPSDPSCALSGTISAPKEYDTEAGQDASSSRNEKRYYGHILQTIKNGIQGGTESSDVGAAVENVTIGRSLESDLSFDPLSVILEDDSFVVFESIGRASINERS